MSNILYVVVILAVVCVPFVLTVKHASYILIYGSIFESLRMSLRRAGKSRGPIGWFFRKLTGLFSCNLCMNTQLAFWLCTLPAFFIIREFWGWDKLLASITSQDPSNRMVLFFTSATLILWWMSIASLSMWYWNLSEFRMDRFEKQRVYYERLLSENEFQKNGVRTLFFTPMLFEELLQRINDECSWIDCPFRRADCQDDQIREWRNEKGENNSRISYDALNSAIRKYHYNKSDDIYKNSELIAQLVFEINKAE